MSQAAANASNNLTGNMPPKKAQLPDDFVEDFRKTIDTFTEELAIIKEQQKSLLDKEKVLTAGEDEKVKLSLDALTKEMIIIKEQQKTIIGLVEDIKILRFQNEEKDKRLAYLEGRVADLEQYTRLNDVIVTGLQIRPRSYARAVTRTTQEPPDDQDVKSTEEQVATFLESKGIQLDHSSIEACHPLPRRSATDRQAVIIRFVNRKHKAELLRQGRKLKGTNVYMNDHLTKQNAEIARNARLLKKERKILNTWTTNCKIFIKLNGPEEKVLVIRKMEDLEAFK